MSGIFGTSHEPPPPNGGWLTYHRAYRIFGFGSIGFVVMVISVLLSRSLGIVGLLLPSPAQALTAASRSAAVASAWAPREFVIAEFLTSLARAPREGIGGEPSDPWTELRRNPLRHCLPVPRNRLP